MPSSACLYPPTTVSSGSYKKEKKRKKYSSACAFALCTRGSHGEINIIGSAHKGRRVCKRGVRKISFVRRRRQFKDAGGGPNVDRHGSGATASYRVPRRGETNFRRLLFKINPRPSLPAVLFSARDFKIKAVSAFPLKCSH